LIKVENTERLIHPMLKSSPGNHWFEAGEIINDIKDKKNFFEYGNDYDEFLPQRIVALYYYISGQTIQDENGNFKTDNGKFLYLTLRTLLFYFCKIYL